MKRIVLSALAAVLSVCAMADDKTKTITCPDGTTREVKPVATMKVVVDGETERTFSFGTYFESDYYAVDFGDGELVVTEEPVGHTTATAAKTAVSGVAKGEGSITVYANDSLWYFSTSTGMSTTSNIESLDLSGLKCVQQLSIGGVMCEAIDLSACDSLTNFTSAKGELKTMDFSNNLKLRNINITDNKLVSIDVSKCAELDQLSFYNSAFLVNPSVVDESMYGNTVTSLDLSGNPAITGLYAQGNKLSDIKFAEGSAFKTLNLAYNNLSAISLPDMTGSSSMLYLNNNQLTELDVPTSVATFDAKNNKIARLSLVDCTKACAIENNCLTIATLPKKPAGLNTTSKIKKFTYAPQAPMATITHLLKKGDVLDLTDMLTVEGGELEDGSEPAVTEFAFANGNGEAFEEGVDYTVVEPGKFRFTNENAGRVHAVMTNAAFPKAVGALAFTSVDVPMVKPLMTMKVTVDGETERTFSFGTHLDRDYYAVDFGDGNPIETEEIGNQTRTATKTAVSGIAKGDGVITLYAENDLVYYFSTATGMSTTSPIESIDLSPLKHVEQLSIGGVKCETIDLSACESLTNFTSAKGELKTMDFSNNLKLRNINLTDNKLVSIDVSKCAELDQLSFYNSAFLVNPSVVDESMYGNTVTSLDLSGNPAITGLYAQGNKLSDIKFAEGSAFKTLNLAYNNLSAISLPDMTGSSSMLYLNNNQLTELDVPTSVATFDAKNNKIARLSLVDCTKACAVENNCLTIATLPKKPAGLNTASKIKKFTYAPQSPAVTSTRVMTKGAVLDLTDLLTAEGELEEGTATTEFSFANADGEALAEGTDYTVEEPGRFRFTNESAGRIHAVMTTAAFPKATADKAFTTVDIPMAKPLVTMQVAVDGETERSFSFGTYLDSDFYAVDFGDGVPVATDEIGRTNTTAAKTAVSGVAKGDGTITIYAENDSIWYFSTNSGMSTSSPVTGIDMSGLKNAHQVSMSGLQMETVDLSACDSLRVFTSQNGSLTSLDFSKNAVLNNANVMNNKLSSVNVSGNSLLDQLNVNGNELTVLDLSHNSKLTNLWASDNKLSSVTFADGDDLPKLGSLYIKNNELTELVVNTPVGTFEADGNKLEKLSIVDCTKSCKIENNCLTIATLPKKPAGLNTASKIKKFTYAPQTPLAVEENITGTLDLSAQLTAVGELEEGEATTVFAFTDADGQALAEGTDYTIEAGVATFLKTFNGIHAVMTSDAFPKAVGDLAFVTTVFNVTEVPTRINLVNDTLDSDDVYTLQGVKLQAPVKGINIIGGKKVYIK